MSVAKHFKPIDKTDRRKGLRGFAATGTRAGLQFTLVCPTLDDCVRTWHMFMGPFLDEKKIQEVVLSKPEQS